MINLTCIPHHKQSRFVSTGLILSSILCHAYISASDDDFDQLFNLSIEELMDLQVTGATLTRQSILSVPSSVTVFNHEQIKSLGVTNIIELMAFVPGFQYHQGSNWNLDKRYSVRGRSISQGLTEVLLVVDGHRLNDGRTGGTNAFTSIYPTQNIERIEFIRGPGAALYGSNAMLGVINIISRKNTNEVSVALGNNEHINGDLTLSKQQDTLSFDVNINYDKDQGDDFTVLSNNDNSPVDTSDPYSFLAINSRLQWHQSRLSFQYYETKTDDYYLADVTPSSINDRKHELYSVAFNQGFQWLSVNSQLQLEYSNAEFNIYGQLLEAGVLETLSNPPSAEPLIGFVNFDQIESYRAFLLNDLAISDTSTLQFGGEYRYINTPTFYTYTNFDFGALGDLDFPVDSFTDLDNKTQIEMASERDILGVFSQFQSEIFDQTQLTLGLRYDSYASVDSNLSPRLGLVHQLNSIHTIKLLYGQAFRAPTEQELNLINNPIIEGNADLDSETVDTWEATWIAHWQQTVVNLTYFENHFDDSILLVSAAGSTQREYTNQNQSPTKGLESEFLHRFNDAWSSQLNFTYLFENADESFKEADYFGTFTQFYQQQSWLASLAFEYVGDRETIISTTSSRETVDDYVLIHTKVNYQWSKALNSHLLVRNLLDEDYETPNTFDTIPEPLPNRGIEFLVGFNYAFD